MRAIDGIGLSNASASSALTKLSGGLYALCATATWGGGSLDLQRQSPDGSTLVDVSTSTKLTANGYATVYLSPGWYQLTVATATAVYASLARVPGE